MTLLVRSLVADSDPQTRVRAWTLPTGDIPAEMRERILRFERRFIRHVGTEPAAVRTHEPDHGAFYRSMGPSAAFFASRPDGHVLGTLSVARIRIRMPRGLTRTAAFAGNLLVVPEARHGPALARLVGAVFRWSAVRTLAGFAQIPEGSASNPERFTRGFGIPTFHSCGAARVISISTAHASDGWERDAEVVDEARVRTMRRSLTRGFVSMVGGTPSMRASRPVRWIALRDGSACACVEDFDAVKRHALLDRSGDLELNHASFLGFRDLASAARILRCALAISAADGVPYMQTSIDESLEGDLVNRLGFGPEFGFRARLAGHVLGGMPRAPWLINSSEI